MSESNLMKLSIAAAVLLVLSIWFGSQEKTVEFEFDSGQPLVTDIDPSRFSTITIQKGTEEEIKLTKVGPSFLVESSKNYPASTAEVNRLITAVLGIKLAAEITDSTEAHGELKVAGGEGCTTVKFLNSDGGAVLGVYVADSADGKQYVRREGDDMVYQADGFVSLRTRALDFLNTQLVEIDRAEIGKVVVAAKDDKVYTIESPEKDKVELQGIPEGKKASNQKDSVFGAATYLNFTDFKAASEAQDLVFANTYTVTTRQKTEYRFEIAQADDKWWVRATASYQGPRFSPAEIQGADEEKLKEIDKINTAVESAGKFTKQHQGWVYELSSWKAESMTKKFDDLLEEDDGKPEEVAASHILIAYKGADRAGDDVTRTKEEAQARAAELVAEVLADTSKFADLAKANSNGPSGPNGGDLGTFKFDTMAKPFSEAAFALEVGAVHPEPVETPFGYHVIMRTK